MKAFLAGLALAFAASVSTAALAETTVIKHKPAMHKKVIIKHGHGHMHGAKKIVIKHRD